MLQTAPNLPHALFPFNQLLPVPLMILFFFLVFIPLEKESDDGGTEFDEQAAKEVLRLPGVDFQPAYVKMITLILMDTFRERFGLTDVSVASEAGMVVEFNEKSIRTWRNDFYENHGDFSESNKGICD